MENEIIIWLLGLLPAIITGSVLFYFQRKVKKRDGEVERLADARRKESFLHLKLLNANIELSYAVAMAVKRGESNGEIEEAIKAYNEAKKEYQVFLTTKTTEYLNGGM